MVKMPDMNNINMPDDVGKMINQATDASVGLQEATLAMHKNTKSVGSVNYGAIASEANLLRRINATENLYDRHKSESEVFLQKYKNNSIDAARTTLNRLYNELLRNKQIRDTNQAEILRHQKNANTFASVGDMLKQNTQYKSDSTMDYAAKRDISDRKTNFKMLHYDFRKISRVYFVPLTIFLIICIIALLIVLQNYDKIAEQVKASVSNISNSYNP